MPVLGDMSQCAPTRLNGTYVAKVKVVSILKQYEIKIYEEVKVRSQVFFAVLDVSQ